MAKKQLRSGLVLNGIAPNILLKHVENTAPFLFKGELDTKGPKKAYLAKLVFYKKNHALLKKIDLSEYFHVCMSAHWSTAGTFVPTDVDNQIRKGLWNHKDIDTHIKKMAKITIDSWTWDYTQVTNRKSFNPIRNQVMSTHEGTWLSVAIGAYCALVQNKKMELAQDVADVILAEIEKEENLLLELREKRDHVNYLRSCALMAHNFGDLDRVIDQWQMSDDDLFKQRIYKLGQQLNPQYSPILYFSGLVNKEFLSVENHRHMSLRQPKCLRNSHRYLVPVGPFMDEWGIILGKDKKLTLAEKAEIITAFFEGYTRQDQALGYVRAFKGMVESLDDGLNSLEEFLPFDVFQEIKKSAFFESAQIPKDEFEQALSKRLDKFQNDTVDFRF